MDMMQKEQNRIVNQAENRMGFIARPEYGESQSFVSIRLKEGVTPDDFSWTLLSAVNTLNSPVDRLQQADLNRRAGIQSVEDSWVFNQPDKGSFQDLFSKIVGGKEALQALGYDPKDQYAALSGPAKYELLTYMDVLTTALTGTEDSEALLMQTRGETIKVEGKLLDTVLFANQHISHLRDLVEKQLSLKEKQEVERRFVEASKLRTARLATKVGTSLLIPLVTAACMKASIIDGVSPTEVSQSPIVEATQIAPEPKVTPTIEQMTEGKSAAVIVDSELRELAGKDNEGAQQILGIYEQIVRQNPDWVGRDLADFNFQTFVISADQQHPIEIAFTATVDGQSWFFISQVGEETMGDARPMIVRKVDDRFLITYGDKVFMESTSDGTVMIVRQDGTKVVVPEASITDSKGTVSFGRVGEAMLVPPQFRQEDEAVVDDVRYVDGVLTAFDESGEAVLYLDGATGEWNEVLPAYPDWAEDEVKSASEVSGVLTAFDESGEPVLVFNEESQEWIKAEDYMALWIEGEWTTEVPVRAITNTASIIISDNNGAGLEYLSISEIENFQTTLTVADVKSGDLGFLVKNNYLYEAVLVDGEKINYHYDWLAGEIVGSKYDSYTVNGVTRYILQLAVDVPDVAGSIVRFYVGLGPEHFRSPLNIEELRLGVENLRESGIDVITDGIMSDEELKIQDHNLYISVGLYGESLMQNMAQSQKLVGSRFGFAMPSISGDKNTDINDDKLAETRGIQLLLDSDLPVDGSERMFLNSVMKIAVDLSIFE